MDIVLRIQRYCHRKHMKYRMGYEPRAVCFTNVPSGIVRLFRQRDRWQRGLIGSFMRNITFRFDKGITMQLIAIPYLLIFDVASLIVWMAGIMQALMDIILDAPNNPNHRNRWIIVILIYLTTELTIDLFTEIERSNLDGERLKIMEVLGGILLQVPKIFVYMFVIMPARFYGTITYAWRKNVW